MRILVTGAAGYLGQRMVKPFTEKHDVRLMDVNDWDAPGEKIIGSVTDLATCQQAMEGMDAMIIASLRP